METDTTETAPLRCECGSEDICICYSAPVFVSLSKERVTKVVVDDEDTQFGGVVRCLSCDRYWIIDEEPEVGIWPQWQFGQ